MTAGRRSRERSTPVRHVAPPPPLPGHVPPARAEPETARARRRRIVTATSIGGAGLLGISLSTKAGSPQFYLLTMGLAPALSHLTWSLLMLRYLPPLFPAPGGLRSLATDRTGGAADDGGQCTRPTQNRTLGARQPMGPAQLSGARTR